MCIQDILAIYIGLTPFLFGNDKLLKRILMIYIYICKKNESELLIF